MTDHHVDRPGVDVRQRTQLTGPNRPTGSMISRRARQQILRPMTHNAPVTYEIYAPDPGICWTTWWLWRGGRTRSHPELGRENPQRL